MLYLQSPKEKIFSFRNGFMSLFGYSHIATIREHLEKSNIEESLAWDLEKIYDDAQKAFAKETENVDAKKQKTN